MCKIYKIYGTNLENYMLCFKRKKYPLVKSQQWVLDFTKIYQAKNVTPYIHILSKHIPEFLHKHMNINQFTQQGIEKLNDQTTLEFAKSTNYNFHNLDALKQIRKCNRIEYLEDHGFQRLTKTITCSVCQEKGHNSHTCEKGTTKTLASLFVWYTIHSTYNSMIIISFQLLFKYYIIILSKNSLVFTEV